MSSESLTPAEHQARRLQELEEDREDREALLWRGPSRKYKDSGAAVVKHTELVAPPVADLTQDKTVLASVPYVAKSLDGQ